MGLAYPLADDVKMALFGAQSAARTRYEAEVAAGGQSVEALSTEWFKPDADDVMTILKQIEQGPGHGFVQSYEDSDGATVLAVTFWKLSSKPAKVKPKPMPGAPVAEAPDHTDDLYFKHGRTKKARKSRKQADHNQLDLFGKSPASKS